MPPGTVNAVLSVTVGFVAPPGAAIRPGEVQQLRATALNTDNSTSDCTGSAVWSSSNDKVLKLTGLKPGEVVAVTAGDAKITAACGPASGELAASVVMSETGIFSQGDGRLCPFYSTAACETGAARQDTLGFTVPRNGTLRLSTQWPAIGGSGVDWGLEINLTCNGTKVSGFPRDNARGADSVAVAASSTCQYELTVRNATSKSVSYQWALSLQ